MIKQLIIIRRDLKMRRGKEIAQGAHAAMAFLTSVISPEGHFKRALTYKELLWIGGSFTKVVLQVHDWDALINAFQLAREHGIEAKLITDNGTTEFNGVPTVTALAIGPEDSEVLDPLFGNLKLY
jgi:PTH2 family peptidyl-tRNA hydrolase